MPAIERVLNSPAMTVDWSTFLFCSIKFSFCSKAVIRHLHTQDCYILNGPFAVIDSPLYLPFIFHSLIESQLCLILTYPPSFLIHILISYAHPLPFKLPVPLYNISVVYSLQLGIAFLKKIQLDDVCHLIGIFSPFVFSC